MRNRYFLLLDIVLLALLPLGSLYLRLDADLWSDQYWLALALYTTLSLSLKLPLFYIFGLYRRYWRYASVEELFSIILTVGLATGILAVIFLAGQHFLLVAGQRLPRSVPFIDGMLTLLVVGGTRFSVRALASARRAYGNNEHAEGKRVLLVGAGDAGAMIVREMRNNAQLHLEPVGFVDDDESKRGVIIQGVRVLGSRADIPKLIAQRGVEEVVIAMPTAPGRVIREIVALCEAARVSYKIVPGIFEILSGQVGVSHLRPVEIEDLLRREPVQIDAEEVARMLSGSRVLVTGGGGSIGGELCRQIARNGPAHLVVVGHGENSLFAIESELRRAYPTLNLSVCVADIRDYPRLRHIFERMRPQTVFHAAAHKHVPLMEANCEDAVTNNVGGTRNLIDLSERCNVNHFVLISSDKAVNPTSVMGATKRVAEMIVLAAARRTGRPYVAVRFGNVLGSRGSVVPVFREQIARGGPVTVTHPDVKRYFMTIPEAVQLVLQAGALSLPGTSGEVFVLDMGDPIKIVNLARDLIELSGLEVGQDIDIVFTGMRPGEKLTEKLFMENEDCHPTRHAKVLVAHHARDTLDPETLEAGVEEMLQAAAVGKPDEVRRCLQALVPDYDHG